MLHVTVLGLNVSRAQNIFSTHWDERVVWCLTVGSVLFCWMIKQTNLVSSLSWVLASFRPWPSFTHNGCSGASWWHCYMSRHTTTSCLLSQLSEMCQHQEMMMPWHWGRWNWFYVQMFGCMNKSDVVMLGCSIVAAVLGYYFNLYSSHARKLAGQQLTKGYDH